MKAKASNGWEVKEGLLSDGSPVFQVVFRQAGVVVYIPATSEKAAEDLASRLNDASICLTPTLDG